MYAVRDAKALAFMQPFFSVQSGSAIRAFDDAVNDGKSPFFFHPEDYILYELGEFDDQSGALTAIEPIKMLVVGLDVFRGKRSKEQKFDSVALSSDVGLEVASNGA